MAGFSGATGVPLKQMQDAIAQSTAWVSETLATYSYGTLTGLKNDAIRMAYIRWTGNATAAPTSAVNVTLPAAYKARTPALSPMFNGKYMESNASGVCVLDFGTSGATWSAASICYPTTT